MSDITVQIKFPTDENGMIGRECLKCERYFKLKPGTGLPIDTTNCPYCDYAGSSNTFYTTDQNEYIRSVATKEAYEKILRPAIDKMLTNLEQSTRSSKYVKITVNRSGTKKFFPIKYYDEKELETHVTCDNCSLEFAIYGVFGRCPDCADLNAFTIYAKSLEVTKRQIDLFEAETNDNQIRENNLKFILANLVGTFDALGKELRRHKPEVFPDKPKNLFQNIEKLNEILNNKLQESLSDFEFLYLIFQVRHIYEHNMGVIDDDFVRRLPKFTPYKGQKYTLEKTEIVKFIDAMYTMGNFFKTQFSRGHNGT